MAKGGVKLELIQSDQRAALGKYRARNHQLALVYWGPDYLDIHSNASFFTSNPDPSESATVNRRVGTARGHGMIPLSSSLPS